MKAARLLILVVVLLALAAVPSAAAPSAGPCGPIGGYDPACDVDHNGVIDVTDIQLTAGHWNQSGTWLSDNQHNHLGQTWTGSNNTLKIEGSFGAPDDNAALRLTNTAPSGNGLDVPSAGYSGVSVGAAGSYGLSVISAGEDGVFIANAGDAGVAVYYAAVDGVYEFRVGSPSSFHESDAKNGFEVAGVQGNGLYVGRADDDGIRIRSAGDDGIQIGEEDFYPTYALFVPSPGTPGSTLLPNTANAAGQWALYTVDNIEAGNVFLSAQTLVAEVGGDQPLTAGDVVAAAGLADPIPGSLNHLARVRLATDEQANVVGVVSSRMALQPLPGKDGEQVLRSVDGPALPGDYVAITVLGAAQVKVQAGGTIQAGQRLTIAANGRARPLGTIKVQLAGGEGTADILENAPVIGVALEPATKSQSEAEWKDGLVWVLVNLQ